MLPNITVSCVYHPTFTLHSSHQDRPAARDPVHMTVIDNSISFPFLCNKQANKILFLTTHASLGPSSKHAIVSQNTTALQRSLSSTVPKQDSHDNHDTTDSQR